MKERIEEILEDKRITQAEFAIRAGISPATITHLFNGRNNLSDSVVSKILDAYREINPMWLLYGEGEKYIKVIGKADEKLPLFDKEQKEEESEQLEQEVVEKSPPEPPKFDRRMEVKSVDNQKQIRKVVFFYTDKTFEEYYPGG
ncbi:MAG: helix-turn-helix domain-containing protein [Lentimicrobiaceae bacterium]|nr:helix-turn-helix domain-containing protein [Lentimicrobiaceae bacterium]